MSRGWVRMGGPFRRGAVIAAVLCLILVAPMPRSTFANPVSALPATTSGIHLGMEFNYLEPTVNGHKTGEGDVDYVFGADAGMHNIPASSGHTWHDKYLSWLRDVAGPGVQRTVSWYKKHHPNWLLYRSDRKTIPTVWGDNVTPLDFTNPAVQKYIIKKWINPALAGGFQGVLFDNDLGFNYLGAAGHFDTHGKWVQQYSGNWNDPTYANAQATAFQKVAAAVHAAHPTATVGINQGVDCNDVLSLNETGQQYADIIMDQEGFTNSANTSLPYVAQYNNQYCPQGKWLTVARWAQHLGRDLGKALFIVNPEPYNVTPFFTDKSVQARADLQWALANYLLVKYAHTYFWWGGHEQQAGNVPAMQREYSAPIGSPTNDFYASQNVYMRNYSNGLAVVNPALNTSYKVTFPAGKYQDLYGHALTSYTMPPHSGLILLLHATTRR